MVRSQLGAEYHIESIPAPIWDSYKHIREARLTAPPRGLDGLNLDCTIIDSNDYLISNTAIRPPGGVTSSKRLLSELWNAEPLVYRFAAGEPGPTLIGFSRSRVLGCLVAVRLSWVLFDCA